MSEEEKPIAISKDMLYAGGMAVLAILLAASIFTAGFGLVKTNPPAQNQSGADAGANAISESALKVKVEQYINQNLLSSQGVSAQVASVTSYNSYLDAVKLDIKNGTTTLQSVTVYASKDGQALILGGQVLNLSAPYPKAQDTPAPPAEVQKSDKPKAQAFVMSFCPYGLQFLKAYVPVIELLGEKADVQVGFVSYAMHGQKELEGNSYIYCVQKEEKAKLASYLRCFVESGNYTSCVATAGADSAKISSCVDALDKQYNITGLFNDQSTWSGGRYPRYPVQDAENQQYGVQGSPTFVLNGQELSVGRTAEAIKTAVCGAFNTPPAECSQTLSSSAEAAGLGKMGTASSAGSTGGCGG